MNLFVFALGISSYSDPMCERRRSSVVSENSQGPCVGTIPVPILPTNSKALIVVSIVILLNYFLFINPYV